MLVIISVFLPLARSLSLMLFSKKQPWLQLSSIENVETFLLSSAVDFKWGNTHTDDFDAMFANSDFTFHFCKVGFYSITITIFAIVSCSTNFSSRYIPMQSNWMLHCTNFADSPFLASFGSMLF